MDLNLKEKVNKLFHQKATRNQETGQSIVLIALALVGIIAFVGLAIDVGFIFARGSQLQAAVDSAALAGVVELTADTTSSLPSARTKSGQFLNANGMPISVTESLNNPGYVTAYIDDLNITNYSVTATWPVETFFLKAIGFQNRVNLTRSATAAIFSLADIYASRRVEDGVLATSNQGIFGPNICVDYGDPFSPLNSPWQPGPYTYKYRIYIPPDYPNDILRVELFDPDSINQATNNHIVLRSDAAINQGGLAPTANKQCGADGGSSNRKNPCLLRTDEIDGGGTPVGGLTLDQVNPYWFVRIDENRGAGAAPGNGGCGSPGSYDARYNTATLYQLYYYSENPDGTVGRIDLANYTGQTGDGVRDNGDHNTDMRWVSPGTDISFGWDFDQPGVDVPVDPGSATSFEIDLTQDIPGILVDPNTNAKYIWLDVTSLSGASENGFEIWAGPPDYVNTVPSEVNTRNRYILNNPGSHSSQGATVFAVGNLPMNSNFSNPVDIPLIYVGPELAGQSIFVSLYDSDSGAAPPVVFYFDSIAFTPDGSANGYDENNTDWAMAFGVAGVDDPDGIAAGVRCRPGSCRTRWVSPPYEITVPGNTNNCDYANPDPDNCTPFYGGRLVARYIGGFNDTYGWQISITGLPYLVR
ncbi:MAG: hypothetical protein HF973_05540 [Chloroflexi bacterium]|nr:hypothetical protein [Chloroflexota bacterium]